MTLKLVIFLLTYVLLAYGNDSEQKENVESYITKEAAKDLRNKLSAKGEQQDDYDEILKKIIQSVRLQQTNEGDEIVYEKKYFDYLPNDLDSEDVTYEDLTHEVVRPSEEFISAEQSKMKRINSRRFRRDLSNTRDKRQSNYQIYYVPIQHVPLRPNVDFYFPIESFDFADTPLASHNTYQAISPYPSRVSNTNNKNPWAQPGQRFHPPGNVYLPAYNNVPSPPHNPSKQGVNNEQFDLDNRVAGFETDDDRPIFDAKPLYRPNTIDSSNNKNNGGGKTSNLPQRPDSNQHQRPTSRPHRPDNDFLRPNEVPQFNIEYPPEDSDDDTDVSTTTRAPLKRVSVKPKQTTVRPQRNTNNNNNRQTKQDNQETTSKVSTTNKVIRPPNKSVPACVLAIVNCCSRFDTKIRQPCFEQYGCVGTFWGQNPCSKDIKEAAFREVEKFSES